MSVRTSNLTLDESLAQPGCPVCRIAEHDVAHAIESINYEFVNDPGFREEVESAWGFCSFHARQWLQHAHPLGTAIIYEAVLGKISARIDALPGGSQSRLLDRVMAAVGSPADGTHDCATLVEPGYCPLCRIRDVQEGLTLDQLLEEFKTRADVQQRYQQSDGLCIPHLNLALCRKPDATALDALRQRALESHRVYRQQLQEIIRKHDYRYRDETFENERGAIDGSVLHVAGVAGIVDRRRLTLPNSR